MTGQPSATSTVLPADRHRTAERRSLAAHRLIAERLDDAALGKARARVERWLADGGPVDGRWARQWSELLSGSILEVASAIARDDDAMTQLRQTTPFAGALPNADRWRLLREVR